MSRWLFFVSSTIVHPEAAAGGLLTELNRAGFDRACRALIQHEPCLHYNDKEIIQ